MISLQTLSLTTISIYTPLRDNLSGNKQAGAYSEGRFADRAVYE